MLVLALLLSISAVLAQKPTPCVTPPQWEGRVFEYDEEKQFFGRAFYSYDAVYQRERFVEEYTLQGDREAYDTLRIFAAQTEYQFNLRTRQCTKQPITRPWRNFGVPVNATFFGENYVGSSAVPNANLLTDAWGYNVTDSQGNQGRYMGIYTHEACIPVNIIVVFTDRTYHSNFFDVTPGISDPSRFIPRPECLQADDE